MRYCAGHIQDLSDALRRRGLWRYVDRARFAENLRKWLNGKTRKGEIDPAVVLMFEIGAKAARLGPLPASVSSLPWAPDIAVALAQRECPLCRISIFARKQDEPARQIEGYLATVIVPLLADNGQRAA